MIRTLRIWIQQFIKTAHNTGVFRTTNIPADWMKKCKEYEVEGPRPRGRPKRTWREVVREDCQACKLNTEDAMDNSKWRKLIKDVRWSGWAWVGECFFWYRPTQVVPDQRLLNGCVCVCVCVRACEMWVSCGCMSSCSQFHCEISCFTDDLVLAI